MTYGGWRRWLLAVAIGMVVFGLFMAAASGTPLFAALNRLIDPAFWAGGTPPAGIDDFRAWVYGVWGATIAGWGVTVAFLAAEPLRRREAWAWRAIAVSTAVCYVFDTGLSIAHGVVINVAFNTVVLVLVAVPLALMRRDVH